MRVSTRPRAITLAALQELLERFADEYNTRRPHRSLARRTPLAA